VLASHEPCKGVSGVTAVLCTTDGKLVSGGRDGRILAWDTAAGAVAAELSGTGAAAAAAHRHGDSDGAPLTNAQVVCCLASPPPHSGPAAASSDPVLASGSWDTTARLWSVESGGQTQVLKGHAAAVLAVSFVRASSFWLRHVQSRD
jgi:WD40 repeat protein